ncbi:unnamed protein product [Microthlaspi erraticum]|uniref:Reverse transcriptase Ty1/copia-type domain-containing protein n=1 Tax=Microthlaspi erraticum TaxID=1685480 RepID=A0A6D2JY62_9BRAS|nr:unnamed protein product [Microthlaspi erraticum]
MTSPPHTPEHNGIAERRHRHIVETGLALMSHASMPRSYWTYAFGTVVYLINHRSTSKVYTSRHVVFHESVFPFATPTPIQIADTSSSENITEYAPATFPPVTIISPPPLGPTPPPDTIAAVTTSTEAPSSSNAEEPTTVTTPSEQSTSVSENSTTSNTSSSDSGNTDPTPAPSPPMPVPSPSPSPPLPAPSPSPPPPAPAPTRTSNRTRKPVQKLNLHTTVSHLTDTIPATVAEALKNPLWRKAMIDEINSHIRNHTWHLVRNIDVDNIVGNMWIFTIKRKPDGSVERYKARIVAKGYNQRPGIDYHETFSPVVKPATIRIVLSTAVSRNWPLQQFDVNNAFLQGRLEDEVYMKQPTGFRDKDNPDAVCKLNKAIYGLKQAPRAWYNELRTFLLQAGFTNSVADASLFIYNKNGILLYMLVYVDDIIITGNSPPHISRFIASLSQRFSLKDLGTLSYFLGIEVTRTQNGLHLFQHRYIADLLHKLNMTNAKAVTTPMEASLSLTLLSGTALDDATEYRMVVGSLQYLSLTRPDIFFSVNKLAQFMHRPTNEHWKAVKRVLRYLSGTKSHDIFLHANNKPDLHAFTDADWAGNKDDYTSTSVYVVYLGSHPVAWSSKKQTGVARSSTEAEYRALAASTSEICWISSLLSELGLSSSSKPVIYCDNIGTTYLAANPVFHSRMKHIALDFHFVRQFVQSGQLRVTHVTSADQLADALTKPLPRSRFQTLSVKIGLSKGRPS